MEIPGTKRKGGIIKPMKKQPLSQTNPFLKDPEERKFWITTTVTSSASIEGVHLSKEALDAGFQIDSPPHFQNHSPPCSPACVTG